MIDKETFCDIIKRIQEEDKKNDAICTFLEDNILDGYGILKQNDSRKMLFELLIKIFNDKDDMIGWWLYEDVDKYLYDSKTNKICEDLTTSEKLYDYLVKNI